MKNHQDDTSEAHSAQALTVCKTLIQVQIALQIAARLAQLSTRVGGINTQFQAVDQLTTIFTQEIERVPLMKPESLGSDRIFKLTPLRLRADHTGTVFHVRTIAHVFVIAHERVTGAHRVVKDHVLSAGFQKLSVR